MKRAKSPSSTVVSAMEILGRPGALPKPSSFSSSPLLLSRLLSPLLPLWLLPFPLLLPPLLPPLLPLPLPLLPLPLLPFPLLPLPLLPLLLLPFWVVGVDADAHRSQSVKIIWAMIAVRPDVVGDRDWPGCPVCGLHADTSPLVPVVLIELPADRGQKGCSHRTCHPGSRGTFGSDHDPPTARRTRIGWIANRVPIVVEVDLAARSVSVGRSWFHPARPSGCSATPPRNQARCTVPGRGAAARGRRKESPRIR